MIQSPILASWATREAVLATMHQKEVVIAPLLAGGFDLRVQVAENFDTDVFGTFTRDVGRTGTQLDAARRKAQAALSHTGASIAIASEGSFASDAQLPFVARHTELVVLIDQSNQLEIIGHHVSYTRLAKGQYVTTPEAATALAAEWGFPTQGVILRITEQSNRGIDKEITTSAALYEKTKALLTPWYRSRVYIETDLRAHRCPARLLVIAAATADLIKNCRQLCPKCTAPGFVVTNAKRGLPCRACGRATEAVAATTSCCQLCQYNEETPATAAYTDPANCQYCNP